MPERGLRSVTRKRGRPRGTSDTAVIGAAAEVYATRPSKMNAPMPQLTAGQAQERARTSAEALATLTSRDELRFLNQAERRALLCQHLAEGIPTDDEGNELPAGRAFYLKCLELLMRTMGDFAVERQPQGVAPVQVEVKLLDLQEAVARRLGEKT